MTKSCANASSNGNDGEPIHGYDPYYEEWSRDVERLQNENDALRQHYYDQEAFLIEQEESWQQEAQTD